MTRRAIGGVAIIAVLMACGGPPEAGPEKAAPPSPKPVATPPPAPAPPPSVPLAMPAPDVDFRVVSVAPAEVWGDSRLEGKTLSGVLVDAVPKNAGAAVTFDAWAAGVKDGRGGSFPAQLLFLAAGAGLVSARPGPGGAQLAGAVIKVGDTKYEAFGSHPMALKLSGSSEQRYTFVKKGSVRFGLVFSVPRAQVAALDLFGTNIPLARAARAN